MSDPGLELTLEIQEAIAPNILKGEEIPTLIRRMAKKTGCCTILEDSTPSILATGFAQEDSPQNSFLQPYCSLQTSSSFKEKLSMNRLRQQLVVTDSYPDLSLNRLLTPVRAGRELLGYLSFLKIDAPFSPLEFSVARHAAPFIGVLLAYHRRIAEVELKLKGNFVEDLLSENNLDPDSIKNRARALEYDIMVPNRVLVAVFDESKQFFQQNKVEQDKFKNELAQRIQTVTALSGKSMVVHRNHEFIILLQEPQQENSFERVQQQAKEIIREVSPLLKSKLYIGIGNCCRQLEDYRKSYQTAKKALEIGEYMITEGQIRSFEQFKLHALFLSTLKPAELFSYAKQYLGPLLEYDEKHQSELTKTLQEYLYLRNNVEGTARSLKLSVSGIKYRLQKIKEITGYDLKDYKVCFDLQLALIILQLFGEYNVMNSGR